MTVGSGCGPRRFFCVAMLKAAAMLQPVHALAQEASGPIEIVTSHRPPFVVMTDDGRVGGLVGDVAAAAFRDAGLDHRWTRRPANAQLQLIARNKGRVCSIAWFKTRERSAFARYSNPVYTDAPLVVLTRAQDPNVLAYRTLADFLADRDLRMGSKRGYVYGSVVDDVIATHRPTIVYTSEPFETMIDMLLARRFDYMIATAEEAAYYLNDGTQRPALTTVAPYDVPPGSARHILCSRKVAEAEIDALNAALRRLAE